MVTTTDTAVPAGTFASTPEKAKSPDVSEHDTENDLNATAIGVVLVGVVLVGVVVVGVVVVGVVVVGVVEPVGGPTGAACDCL